MCWRPQRHVNYMQLRTRTRAPFKGPSNTKSELLLIREDAPSFQGDWHMLLPVY